MLKNISNLGTLLNKLEQKNISGGKKDYSIDGSNTFTCYCGFVNSEGIDQTRFYVYADTINQALNVAGPLCHGLGATCNG